MQPVSKAGPPVLQRESQHNREQGWKELPDGIQLITSWDNSTPISPNFCTETSSERDLITSQSKIPHPLSLWEVFPNIYPKYIHCYNYTLFFLFLNINDNIFFHLCSYRLYNYSWHHVSPQSPLQAMTVLPNVLLDWWLPCFCPPNSSIFFSNKTDTSRPRFLAKPNRCWAEQSLVQTSTLVSHRRWVPLSFHHTVMPWPPLCWAPWDGFLQCWALPTLSLGRRFFLFLEITTHDIHHCSSEGKACFATIGGY